MRRIAVILLLIAILAVSGVFIWRALQAAQAEPQFEIVRQAVIERGNLAATVSAAGAIEPEAQVSLSFGTPGTVTAVNVVRGQQVREGTVLATLNTSELELALQQASDAVRIQELLLEQALTQEPSPATLAAAQADVDAAQANLSIAQANLAQAQASVAQAQAAKAQLLAGPTTAEIAAAQADIATQEANVKALQDNYDIRIIGEGIGGFVEENARFQLNAAQQALTAARARLEVLEAGPRPADVQATDAAIAAAQAAVLAAEGSVQVAQANVARAEAAYARLSERPGEVDIAILEAQIDAARTNLALAQLRLDQSRLIAPIDGVVASLLVQEGEQAILGAPAIILVDEGAYHLNVSVDEIDIDRIALNQPADITLDALPDVAIQGTVADIAPIATSLTGGVVTYQVTINILDVGEVDLRPGMTANASIVVQELTDVLIAPNWAIRVNRDTGVAFVNRLAAEGVFEEIPITTGLRNEQFSEVVEGLTEGQTVVITSERETFSFFGGNN